MLYYSKRIIIFRWADLSDFSSIVVGKMCIFVSRPMKIDTFSVEKRDPPKRVVDFPRERDTFRNKIIEIVEDFDENSYNNNSKPWKSSRILRVNPSFSFFFLFSLFFHFFIFTFFHVFYFFHFFNFLFFQFFIFLHFLSFSFIFLHFLSFSFNFFHFLSFSFIFFHFLSFLTCSFIF